MSNESVLQDAQAVEGPDLAVDAFRFLPVLDKLGELADSVVLLGSKMLSSGGFIVIKRIASSISPLIRRVSLDLLHSVARVAGEK